MPIAEQRVQAWIAADGDRTLRVDYDLDERSLVWDVGGYEGNWSAEIAARYRSTIEIFEPVEEFVDRLQERFRLNPDVHVHAFGLGGESRTDLVAVNGDRTSLFETGELQKIRIVDVLEQLQSSGVQSIDLLKVNIEGAEYELLDRLIASGRIADVRHLQVQFHDFVPRAEARRDAILHALKGTHRATYSFPWVWEAWDLQERRH
jgi:FkbM family methyltransferase